MARTPAVGSRWQHRNGNRYRVLALANTDSDNHEKYPPTVVYQGPNGKVWSRRLSDWERSFTALPPATEPSPTEGMNIAQRILHVGGRDTAGGYIEFGSIQAVEALVRQVLRDLSSELLALQSPESFEEWSMGERSNPNNCASCRHKQNPDGGHCYMFRFEPTEMCAQHTSQIHALQFGRRVFEDVIRKQRP